MSLRRCAPQKLAPFIDDILWHRSTSMTRYYSVAQVLDLHQALEKIKEDSGHWNKSLATLRREQEATIRDTSPRKVPAQRKTA